MRLFFNNEEISNESAAAVIQEGDRLIVKTSEGSFSAVAVRQGESILVSYQGHQYKLDTRRNRAAASGGTASGEYRAPMPGQIVDVLVEVGAMVTKGQKILVLEAMKTQQPFNAPFDGTVTTLNAVKGTQVKDGELLAVVEEA